MVQERTKVYTLSRVATINPSMRSRFLGIVIGLSSRQSDHIIFIDEPCKIQLPLVSVPSPGHQGPDMRNDMTPPSTDVDRESPPRDKILTKSWKDDDNLDLLDANEEKDVFDILESH
jgi:hypothetical protein